MSGIETVGLVVAAIPLVIEALKSIIFLVRWEAKLEPLIAKLWNSYADYGKSIEILLCPITSAHEYKAMTSNSNNALWKNKDMVDALQERLGNLYQPYMKTIQQMEEILTSLAKALDIKVADKISQQGLAAIALADPSSEKHSIQNVQFTKRVKFLMIRRKVERLLAEFEACIRQLDTYLTKEEINKELYKAKKKTEFGFSLRSIEENATRLHDVLSQTCCPPRSSHHAGILLEQRLVQNGKRVTSQQKEYAEKVDVNCFGISLLQSLSPRKWLDMEFGPVEDQNNRQQVSSVVSQPQGVTNLYSVLQQPSHPYLGFYLDSNGHLRRAYPAQPQALDYLENAVSLGEILAKRQASLSITEVYSLSITLCSSLLQLSNTPWLGPSWDTADIIFLRANDKSGVSVDVRHPYLTREYKSDNARPSPHNTYPNNDCPKLVALGVLLIEINANQPFESLRIPEDHDANSERIGLDNLLTCKTWVEEQKNKGKLSNAFLSAILYCFKCFLNPSTSLQDREFRKTVEKEVLAPLVEDFGFLVDPTAP